MKKIILSVAFFLVSVSPVFARSGCCSHHGGVCGCGCCDGTGLSATCAPYYPSCNSAPEVTAAPVRVATPVPTRVYTPTPTKVATPTPTKKVTPTPTKKNTLTPTIKLTETPTPTITVTTTPAVESLVTTVTPSPAVRAARRSQSGFWGWLSRLFGGK